MNILLTPVMLKENFGYPSVMSSLKGLWGEFDDDLKMTAMSTDRSEEEQRLRQMYGIGQVDLTNLSRRKNFFKVLSMCRKFRRSGRIEGDGPLAENLGKLITFDAIAEMRGICFTDDIRQRFYTKLFNHPLWIFAKVLGIPVVKYTTAIGPARTLATKFSIWLYLGKFCDLVLLRDDESHALCKALNLKSKYMTVPDTAFWMPAERCEKAESLRALQGKVPIIGISVSHQQLKRAPGYLESMTELVNELVEKLHARVLLMPNELAKDPSADDRHVAKLLFEATGQDGVEIVDVAGLTPGQIKSVVAACDATVCARYHSVIASLSSGTPVLALSWHHKYREAMKLFGMERYVVEKEDIGKSVVKSFFAVYDNRENIREELKRGLPQVLAKVRAGAEAFYAVIGEKKGRAKGSL